MLEKKLKKAKNERKNEQKHLIYSCIWVIISFIGAIWCFTLYKEISFWGKYLFRSGIIFSIVVVLFFIYCSMTISSLSDIKEEINDILFRQTLPTEYCYDVRLKKRSIHDVFVARRAKDLCIRYREDLDKIEFHYKLEGEIYHDYVSIQFAKHLFICEFFK